MTTCELTSLYLKIMAFKVLKYNSYHTVVMGQYVHTRWDTLFHGWQAWASQNSMMSVHKRAWCQFTNQSFIVGSSWELVSDGHQITHKTTGLEFKKKKKINFRGGPFLCMVFPICTRWKLGWVVRFENVNCANKK